MRKILYFFLLISFYKTLFGQCCAGDFIVQKLAKSGVYAGYGIQFYDPAGLNRYIELYNAKYASTILTKMDDFGLVSGFRAGANLIQIQVDEFLVGLKISYNQMKQKNSAERTLFVGGVATEQFDLSLSSFGIGVNSSWMISKRFEIKFLDVNLTWNSAKLINSYTDPFTFTEHVLTSSRRNLGFSIQEGVIFYIIPPQIALELIGGYSFLSLPKMKFDNGDLLSESPDGGAAMENFIIAGGFFAALQAQISLPFK